ncbi:MAG: homocysteine S-methyltransferase family protein, partial [Fimbriimonas ginsengisoli]|nr:homocysteine S-methyltransferase family protein [Fimbriimonas ginsengisoli]
MESALLDALAQRVLVYDGAMGTQIQAAGLGEPDFGLPEALLNGSTISLDGCNEALNLSRPEVIEAIHRRYLDAGADLIETNTFGCTSIVLAEYGIEHLVREIAAAAGQIARRAADAVSTPARPRFVVGAIGPGTKLVSLGQTTWQELEGTYCDGFIGLLEAGVDALLIETIQDLLMAKATIVGAKRAMEETGIRRPLFVQVTMEQTGTMLLGTELGAALNMIEAFPEVTAFGINCATGPAEMGSYVQFLSHNSTRPISVLPNAGLPVMENGKALYKLTPDELAGHHERFVTEYGVAMVGGCCGTTPDHIRAVADTVGGRPHTASAHWLSVRHLFSGFDFSLETNEQAAALKLVGCSSLYGFQPYKQDASFLIVGEKTNANGSRAFRDLLAQEDWEGLTELARELEGEGSHVLDVCTAYVGR